MAFTLDEDGEKWCKDTWQRALEELRAIPSSSMSTSAPSSSGKQLTDTLVLILRLERNWIRWKNAGCPSFDKPAMNRGTLKAKVRERRREVLKKPAEYAFQCGSRGLSEIWDRGWDEIENSLTTPPAGYVVPLHFWVVKLMKGIGRRIWRRWRGCSRCRTSESRCGLCSSSG